MRSTIASSVLLASLATAGIAGAQPAASERAMAEALFREGKKLLGQGKVHEACEKFASSYKIDQAGGTLINLAKCHEEEGKTATAWGEFNDALAMAKKAGRRDRQKAASDHIAALEPKLSRVTLTVPTSGAAPSLELKLDGVVLAPGALGTGMPVDPGEHTVSASAPGRIPWETRVSLGKGVSRTIQVPELELVPVPVPPPPPPPPNPWKKVVGGVGVGLGGVGLILGGVFGVRAVVMGGRVASACQKGFCSPDGMDALDSGRTSANVANAMLPIGAVLAGGGITLLVLSAQSPDPAKASSRLTVLPLLGPGTAALAVGGAF